MGLHRLAKLVVGLRENAPKQVRGDDGDPPIVIHPGREQ
jgi:hypothetical protein